MQRAGGPAEALNLALPLEGLMQLLQLINFLRILLPCLACSLDFGGNLQSNPMYSN